MNQNPIINETENAATENIDATNIASETPPLSPEPCELTNKITELTNQINSLEKDLLLAKQNEKDTVLRAKAEVENMRRRTESEIEKNHKFAIEKFATTLLPVIDSLERAIELSNPESSELQAIHEGLVLTLTTFCEALNKFNIIVVDQANVPFDPAVHEAMTIMDSQEHASNHVVLVMQKGYTLNGRLLRPARVAISK